jgi:lipopolysaccharide transport system ATP-binding protein
VLLGLSKTDIQRKTEEFIDFSGLGDFIDLPIRTYSSGMTMWLAFSIATSVEADILLMDECLCRRCRLCEQSGRTIESFSRQDA